MACCPTSRRNSGYATPAALVFALAIALIATALVHRGVLALRLARADMARTEAEYGLDGAHFLGAATIVRSHEPGAFLWTVSTDVGWIEVLAEPEDAKLSPEAASQLSDETFARLGVTDPAALKGRLAQLAGDPRVDLADLDLAPLWRACASRMISPSGRARQFVFAAPVEPQPSHDLPKWRVGEVWSLRATTATGWRDERIVRFTGDARHPAAVIARRMARSHGGDGRCGEILDAIG